MYTHALYVVHNKPHLKLQCFYSYQIWVHMQLRKLMAAKPNFIWPVLDYSVQQLLLKLDKQSEFGIYNLIEVVN